jgi:hypothetical protein
MRAEHYLIIPNRYLGDDRPLHWSESGDAVENGDGSTFAFGVEVIHFLEGFASQRPMVHFGFILHLLAMLRPGRLPRPVPASLLSDAFYLPGRNIRNAGAFCALLCRDAPGAVDPPTVEQLWAVLMMPGWLPGTDKGEASPDAHYPPWSVEVFDDHVRIVLQRYTLAEVLHWIREGCGSATRVAEKVAEEVLEVRPRSLAGVLAALAQHVRLRESVPFVGQLVSALTLPPRKLIQPELPLGGFSDVTTRGPVEHLLPSQLVFEGLEFVRRHAQNELLYFRREEPQQPTAEALVVLLDQGVRTWGIVRVVLTAALFALGQLAGRKRLPLRLAATSNAGRPCDPLEAFEADVEKLLAASDLSPHPGLALETVLEEEPDAVRDVVLLTHPRSLAEPDVHAAARRAGPHTRLFAVTVNDRGEVGLHQLRHGGPVSLTRFQVDLTASIPAAPRENPAPRRAWQGDVEPIGYPFLLGLDFGPFPRFSFDSASEWLLVAAKGLLYLARVDGSSYEILPHDSLAAQKRLTLLQVLGVTGGFLTVWRQENQLIATHYDIANRKARRYMFELTGENSTRVDPQAWCYYLPRRNVLVVKERELYARDYQQGVCLSTGARIALKGWHGLPADESLKNKVYLPLQGASEPDDSEQSWTWPYLTFEPDRGSLRLHGVRPAWPPFTPLEDNTPALRGSTLQRADCQGHVLAAEFEDVSQGRARRMLRLFRGPEGIPQAALVLPDSRTPFVLSNDGRLLAWQKSAKSLEVRETTPGGRVCCLRSLPRYHSELRIQLHHHALWIGNTTLFHLARWNTGCLVWSRGVAAHLGVEEVGPPGSFSEGRPDWLPTFLGPNVTDRFRLMAETRRLLAVTDRFGQVALLTRGGRLVCVFVTWNDKLAAWTPDGACFGAARLLGCPETPGAARKIGQALLTVSRGTGSE